jgi:CO/xanthine dehydrogenase FAD-binding subunit
MQDFEFHRAESVAGAVAAVRGAGEGKYLGGGQSLIPVMSSGWPPLPRSCRSPGSRS